MTAIDIKAAHDAIPTPDEVRAAAETIQRFLVPLRDQLKSTFNTWASVTAFISDHNKPVWFNFNHGNSKTKDAHSPEELIERVNAASLDRPWTPEEIEREFGKVMA